MPTFSLVALTGLATEAAKSILKARMIIANQKGIFNRQEQMTKINASVKPFTDAVIMAENDLVAMPENDPRRDYLTTKLEDVKADLANYEARTAESVAKLEAEVAAKVERIAAIEAGAADADLKESEVRDLKETLVQSYIEKSFLGATV
jgi:hypothetical protein